MTRLRMRHGRQRAHLNTKAVRVRRAGPGDAEALERLAQLDSVPVPPGSFLVAEVGDELHAALSLSDGKVLANPFHPTEHVIELLRERSAELSA